MDLHIQLIVTLCDFKLLYLFIHDRKSVVISQKNIKLSIWSYFVIHGMEKGKMDLSQITSQLSYNFQTNNDV